MRSLAHGFVLVACLSACTGSVKEGTGGHSTTSSSGSEGTGAQATASSGGASTVTTDPAVCTEFANQGGLASVTLHLINNTGQPILISPGPECWKSITPYPFSISPVTGGDGTIYPGTSASDIHTCGARLTQVSQCEDCGGGYGFPEDPYRLLAPGSALDLPWHGTGNRGASMPAECFRRGGPCEWASTVGDTDCTQVVPAPAGSYVVTAQAFSTCGTCTADACSCHGTTPATSEPATFSFPGTGVVDVVFDACAFGCPDGG